MASAHAGRLNEEIKRQPHAVRVFPSDVNCLRPIRALTVEIQEDWPGATRCLSMGLFEEHEKAMRFTPNGAARQTHPIPYCAKRDEHNYEIVPSTVIM